MTETAVEFRVREADGIARSREPVTVGVPIPRGQVRDAASLSLVGPSGTAIPVQARVTDTWPDGSARWVLLDFLIAIPARAQHDYSLCFSPAPASPGPAVGATESAGTVTVETGAARFVLERGPFLPFRSVSVGSREIVDPTRSALTCEDASGRRSIAVARDWVVEERGPIRTTLFAEGAFEGTAAPLVFFARLHFFSGLATVRAVLTVRNPRRAVHPGGVWELGDAGSVLVEDLSWEIAVATGRRVAWSPDPTAPLEDVGDGPFELYQDSSGGENWLSRVHVARDGTVPMTLRGYRASGDRTGLRASPRVVLHDGSWGISASVRHFWESFPKAIDARAGLLSVRLFPRQFAIPHEIQGGEQKTHEIAWSFGPEALSATPDAFQRPLVAVPTPETFARSGAVPYLVPRAEHREERYQRLVDAAIEGPNRFEAKRERADEYGWRNFGEMWADHESRFDETGATFISHYNNQYDAVLGAFFQFARSGDLRWFYVMDELARHVVDIDIYHTDEDKPAYNRGLFWPTQHYVDGGRSTHRTYPAGAGGGGPDGEHNYTSGLRHWWLLTGNALGREGSLDGARRTVAADDGGRTPFRWIVRAPTGLASRTRALDYHGPGRGAGNSITALLDAWRTTGEESWLSKADEIVRRTIHPRDDVAARNLLDAENRWSYTVHLQALGRYLDERADAGRLDFMYSWARESLLAYARWMVDHEGRTLDRTEQLEFPTETWAAQDLRKADVFAFAALHADGDERARFLERARWFRDESLAALDAFPTKTYTRPFVLLMRFGPMLAWLEQHPDAARPKGPDVADFGRPRRFVAQKARAMRRVRNVFATAAAGGAGFALARMLGA